MRRGRRPHSWQARAIKRTRLDPLAGKLLLGIPVPAGGAAARVRPAYSCRTSSRHGFAGPQSVLNSSTGRKPSAS